MDNIIEFKNVSFSYEEDESSRPVLFDGLDFSIQRGSFTVILGHNGSGKSTLARMCNGMLLPEKGTVTVNGISTLDENRDLEIRRTVGLVFQNPDNQIVSTVVEEDVAFGPENLGLERGEIINRVSEALETVGMSEYRRHATHKLSGGQKQRIAIAGILAMRPECIVLDEPTSMLDPHGRAEVLDVLKKLNRERNMTVVMITHYMEEAALADRVVVMNSGKITIDSDCRGVYARHGELVEAGLDLPQPMELVRRLRSLGCDLPETVLSVDECAQCIADMLKQNKS